MEDKAKFYKRAMEISDRVIPFAKRIAKEGINIKELAEKIEKKIIELGAKPAFPVNISINEIAAHYTPTIDEKTVLKDGDLVKIDIGVHVEGYICDRAFTVCIGEGGHELIKAAEEALKEALKVIKVGNRVCDVSKVVEEVVSSFGFNPVRNLCGHGLKRYVQHAEPTIPNCINNIEREFKKGEAIAMEVFVTNGLGWVKDSYPGTIFSLIKEKPIRMSAARNLLRFILKEFKTLPFTERWILNVSNYKVGLYELVREGIVKEYPVLKEKSNGLVAQAEETILLF